MYRLHDRAEHAKRNIGNSGKACLNDDGERAELERHDAADDGGCDDPEPAGSFFTLAGEPIAVHYRPINKEVPDKAAIESHVPYIRAERHKPAVGKEQALYCQYRDHRQESCPWPQYRGKEHTAAYMAGGAGAGDGVVDHLTRENERRHNCHRG